MFTGVLSFIFCFLYVAIMVLVASFFLCGFFDITRGELEVMPDDTIEKRGKIFRSWSLFWLKKANQPKVYWYSGEQLKQLCNNISKELRMRGFDKHQMMSDVLTGKEIDHTLVEIIKGDVWLSKYVDIDALNVFLKGYDAKMLRLIHRISSLIKIMRIRFVYDFIVNILIIIILNGYVK